MATGGEPPRPRSPAPASGQPAAARSTEGPPRADAREWSAARKLDYLREKNLGNCQRCALARTRSNIVFGVGNPDAEIMFVGEAPGQQEDRQGIPFVGRAGERLNLWLDMLGIPRDHAYIANVLKCRPPNNRDPEPEEVARCSPFLRAQIRAIRPKVLVALGRFAGCLLTGVAERPLYQMRGRVWSYQEEKLDARIPVVVTYHPSYVLRQGRDSPPGKSDADAQVLTDLRQVVGILRGA
ncbi:MAG: uracil-DNA glycosylase [Myxococcales bacterium]|nr:uracil-DNA glycosylase [Myxococcales bacterium]